MLNTNHNILFKAIILALCVISFVHIFLFPLNGINTTSNLERIMPFRTYSDFEKSLCINNNYNSANNLLKHHHHHHHQQQQPQQHRNNINNHNRRRMIKFNNNNQRNNNIIRPCPQYGIVTIIQGGRLGNQMWEYASVWALARRTGLEAYIPYCIRHKLDELFDQLTVPTFHEIAHCTVHLDRMVRSLDAWNFTNQSIILPKYNIQPELVLNWRHDIVQEFSLRRKLRDRAQQILRHAVKQQNVGQWRRQDGGQCTEIVFVGVHVRRTDYVHYLMRKHNIPPANITFYTTAMDYFTKKFECVLFVVVSDDLKWCLKMFQRRKRVYIETNLNVPSVDLAILAACNHTIYDYGTFGEWGALLAGGETIYYNLTQHSSSRIGQILKEWHTI